MSDTILALLQNADPQQRKRGITAAAKSADPRYLKPLARLAKGDPDADLRKLAKKAGTYIHHQQQQQQQQASADDLDGLRAALGGPDDAGPRRAPDPDGIWAVGQTPAPTPQAADAPNLQMLIQDGSRETDPAQAESHYDIAFNLHLKGKNARAALELATAFYLNPAYGNDPTAVAFAAEMTGLPPAQAVPYIANPDNWRALTDRHGGFKRKEAKADSSELQRLYLWLAGAVILVIALGLTVWVLQSGIVGEAIQQTRFGTPTPLPAPTATAIPQ